MTTVQDSTCHQDHSDLVRPSKYVQRHKRIVKILCLSLVPLFALAVIFQVCAIVLDINDYSRIAAGIWCGVLYAATSVVGLFAVRNDDKAMTILLLCMAATSVLTSLALLTLAILSLINVYCKSNLWIASNATLVVVGFIGTFISVSLVAIAVNSILHNKQRGSSTLNNVEEIDKDPVEEPPTEHKYSGASELSDVLQQPTTETNSSVGSGIYESIKSKEGSVTGSACPEMTTLDLVVEPIYAVPLKKKKSAANSINGDFDNIQVDNRRDSHEKDKNVISNSKWFNMEVSEESAGSDVDDSQQTRNIELAKEDVIVHAPSSNN